MYKSVILPVAKQDIKEAATWYNERQSGLGKRFTDHVRKTVHYIRQNPNAVAKRYDNIRTALLDAFPYMIHFTADEDKKIITVLAVLHTARDPKAWKERK
jgi:plasmid stabilization system protein ParE